MKQHLTSFVLGLLGAFAFMIVLPYGSTDPTTFGFYWSLFMGLFISFLVAWTVKKFQKKPEE
jgi:membrane protein implicated in regulation of membrane protease activity